MKRDNRPSLQPHRAAEWNPPSESWRNALRRACIHSLTDAFIHRLLLACLLTARHFVQQRWFKIESGAEGIQACLMASSCTVRWTQERHYYDVVMTEICMQRLNSRNRNSAHILAAEKQLLSSSILKELCPERQVKTPLWLSPFLPLSCSSTGSITMSLPKAPTATQCFVGTEVGGGEGGGREEDAQNPKIHVHSFLKMLTDDLPVDGHCAYNTAPG